MAHGWDAAASPPSSRRPLTALVALDPSMETGGFIEALQAAGISAVIAPGPKRARRLLTTTRPDVAVIPYGAAWEAVLVLLERKSIAMVVVARPSELSEAAGRLPLAAVVSSSDPNDVIAAVGMAVGNDESGRLPAILEAGPVRVDRERRLAFLDGRPVELPPKELDVLGWLVRNAGRPVSSNELKGKVWPEADPVTVEDVHRHVYRLRKRLGDRRRRPALISNRRGYGYVLNPASRSVAPRRRERIAEMRALLPQQAEGENRAPRIRVLIADENNGERDSLIELLGSEDEMEVMTARDIEQAIQLVQVQQPDVALVDVGIADGHADRAVRELRRLAPASRVLAWSAWRDHDKVGVMLRAGATGTLLKGSSPHEIVAAVRGAEPHLAEDAASEAAEDPAAHSTPVGDDEAVRHRLERLQRACTGEGLAVAFQPIVELRSGKAVGLEALARLSLDPRRPPEMWFAEAAELGLEAELDLAVLRAAMKDSVATPADLFLSVNLSPTTIESPRFEEVLAELANRALVVEISVASHVPDWAVLDDALRPLRAMGGRVAADDVGAGPATLDHLVLLGPDFIKLDALLVRGIDEDPARRELAGTVAALGSRMGAGLVAEGIESEAEREALLSVGIEYGQGNYLAPAAPMPPGKGPNEGG